MAKRLVCRGCKLVFDLDNMDSISGRPGKCPACGSGDIFEAPAWAPLNSGYNIFKGNTWEYECQNCKYKFALPIPASPTENRGRKCPSCGGDHLHNLTIKNTEPLYCG